MNHLLSRKPAAPVRPTWRQRGVTMLESLIAVSVTTVALGSALPGFEQARERRHLEGAAAQLETDIAYTRSLAVAQNQGVRMGFDTLQAGTCYTVHTGPANACSCDATGATTCSAGAEAIRTVYFPAQGPVALRANVRSILFDPRLGTSTPTGTLRVVGRSDAAIHQIVNIMGRVRSCSPAGSVAGYPRC
jgi:type IV fimbrial biogenesis protein FimT